MLYSTKGCRCTAVVAKAVAPRSLFPRPLILNNALDGLPTCPTSRRGEFWQLEGAWNRNLFHQLDQLLDKDKHNRRRASATGSYARITCTDTVKLLIGRANPAFARIPETPRRASVAIALPPAWRWVLRWLRSSSLGWHFMMMYEWTLSVT